MEPTGPNGNATRNDGGPTPSVAVVIPTRSRPVRLGRCLDSMAAARRRLQFPVYVCDSSPTQAERDEVRQVCERFDWVSLSHHDGKNISAARNTCTRFAQEDLIVNSDDDLELEPQAIEEMVDRYLEGQGRHAVSGSVSWGTHWTTPVKTRPIGYGRPPRDGETADFITGALFLYPRSFGLAWPWHEGLDCYEDIFIGALWRSHGVEFLFAPEAKAKHPEIPAAFDESRMAQAVHEQRWHIYVLLFDALIANPSLRNFLSYETLGFMASAKLYLFRPRWAIPFLRSWIAGHRLLIAHRRQLKALVRTEVAVDVP